MYKVLIILSAFALLILIIVTAILVKVNWSEKLYSPLLSLGLAGTVTTFITVLLLLKGEEFENSFTTLMVINSETRLPPFLRNSASSQLNNRLSGYNKLISPKIIFNNKEIKLFDQPQNERDEAKLLQEFLQYKIFMSIIEMHYKRESLYEGIGGLASGIHKPYKVTERERRPLKDLQSNLLSNRFFNNPEGISLMDTTMFLLPLGTKVEFSQVSSPQNSEVVQHLVILTKPYYFTIEIVIEVGLSSNQNSTPPGLELSPEIIKFCKTRVFPITLKAKFEKITAGNWRTSELKNWTKWMFEEISLIYCDNKK